MVGYDGLGLYLIEKHLSSLYISRYVAQVFFVLCCRNDITAIDVVKDTLVQKGCIVYIY